MRSWGPSSPRRFVPLACVPLEPPTPPPPTPTRYGARFGGLSPDTIYTITVNDPYAAFSTTWSTTSAVGQVHMLAPTAPAWTPYTTYSSSFETGWDGWTNSKLSRIATPTGSGGTGPVSASDGSWYVYAEHQLVTLYHTPCLATTMTHSSHQIATVTLAGSSPTR